jgi:hypothetical protein
MSKFKLKCSCIFCRKETDSSGLFWHKKKGCDKISTSILPKPKRVAWNKGKTKETDERIAKASETLSKTQRQQVQDGVYVPRKMGKDARLKLSEEQSLRNRGGKSKWFVVNGIKVQGTWEYKIALKLNEMNISWTKPKTNSDIFKYELDGKTKSYAPDFFLPEENIYLEVKGYWWGDDRRKMDAVIKQHPDKNIQIIEKEQYQKLLQGELVWS